MRSQVLRMVCGILSYPPPPKPSGSNALSQKERFNLRGWANREAQKYGYDNWRQFKASQS